MCHLLSFLVLFLHLARSFAFIIPRIIADIECLPETSWMNNALGQSPCVVVKKLTSDPSCVNEDVVMDPLPSGGYYPPDFLGQRSDACLCNRAIYTLISACGKCQGLDRSEASWNDFAKNCPNVHDGYPANVPGDTQIPQWATFNDQARTDFDLAAVSKAALANDETAPATVQATTTVIATQLTTSTSSTIFTLSVSTTTSSATTTTPLVFTTAKLFTTTKLTTTTTSSSLETTSSSSSSSFHNPSQSSSFSTPRTSELSSTVAAAMTISRFISPSVTNIYTQEAPTATSISGTSSGVSIHLTSKPGLIVGGVVGGFAILGLIAGLIVWLIRRRKLKTPSRMSSTSALGSEHDRMSQVHIIRARRSVGSSFWNRATPFREPEHEHESETIVPPESPSVYSEVFAFRVPDGQPAWPWTKFVEDIPGPSRRDSDWSGPRAF